MPGGYSVKVTGLEELAQKFAGAEGLIDRELKDAMKRAVITVEGEVKPLAPVGVSSRLRNSIGSSVEGSGSKIVGRVGSSLKGEAYPSVMEYGRRPGAAQPPAEALARWVHIVMGVPTEKALSVAFVVARNIARRGIKGRFYFKRGWEASESRVMGFFRDALGKIAEGL